MSIYGVNSLPKSKIFNSSKLKAFADNKFNVGQLFTKQQNFGLVPIEIICRQQIKGRQIDAICLR